MQPSTAAISSITGIRWRDSRSLCASVMPASARRHLRPGGAGPDRQVAREQRGQQHARQHAGDEELGDRDLGADAVDDHDDRRRDQQPQRAGAGQRADRDAVRVAAALQLGQAHLADRGAGGGARARHGGEDRAADHVDVQQPPRQRLHPRRQAAEHVVRQPGAEQDLAHPDEQRQRGQRPARRRCPRSSRPSRRRPGGC